MKTCIAVVTCLLILWSGTGAAQGRLANAGKSGLHVRTIDQVLRLRDQEVDLGTAALIVSENWSSLVHGRAHLESLDEMAEEIAARLRQMRVRPGHRAIPVINEYLFGELGFASIPEADDPNDLFLHSVLNRRRGYCLSLSVLYLALGERLGLPLHGVVVPGHFFVRYDNGRVRFNIETMNKGGSAPDEHYMDKFNVPGNSGENIYMKNLSKIETLGCFFNNLGNVYGDVGNLERARLAFERAVQINPGLSESRANLGNLYLGMGRVEDALRQYQAAIRLNPNDSKLHNNLGNGYLEKGWLNYAINEYRTSMQLDPNHLDPYRNLALAFCRQERFGQALSPLRQALALEPRDAGVINQLAEVYYNMGRYGEAMAQFRKALSLKRDLPEALHGLGLCYRQQGQTQAAIEAYKQALAVKPDMLVALLHLGNVYFELKQFDEAIEHYTKAVTLAPKDSSIPYNLGVSYAGKEMYAEAVPWYVKALENDPKMGDAHHALAYCYYRLKQYESAWKHVTAAQGLGTEVEQDLIEAIRQQLK